MKYTIKALSLSVLLLTLFSCADTTSVEPSNVEQTSLDAWVKLNKPNAKAFKDGMYMTTLTEAAAGAEEIKDGSWVLLNYVGYDLNENIYANRYENIAKIIFSSSKFNPRTHYAPQLVRIVKDTSGVTPGQYEALKTMKVGQEVELIMPSAMAYGSYGSGNELFGFEWGFNGNTVISSNKPAIVNMVATVSVRDIVAYENKLVYDYAKANLNGVESETDTIAPNLYASIDFTGADMTDTIDVDSSFYYKFVVKTLDGFTVDTNYPDTALVEWNHDIIGALKEYTAHTEQVEAFKTIISTDTLRSGCKFTMVFTSKYGYGYQGTQILDDSEVGQTLIQPYTPLVYSVVIVAKEEDK